MARHKYKVGQHLRYRPPRTGPFSGSRDCQIVRLLPIENGVFLYRIKCSLENVERVVSEVDLAHRPVP